MTDLKAGEMKLSFAWGALPEALRAVASVIGTLCGFPAFCESLLSNSSHISGGGRGISTNFTSRGSSFDCGSATFAVKGRWSVVPVSVFNVRSGGSFW